MGNKFTFWNATSLSPKDKLIYYEGNVGYVSPWGETGEEGGENQTLFYAYSEKHEGVEKKAQVL